MNKYMKEIQNELGKEKVLFLIEEYENNQWKHEIKFFINEDKYKNGWGFFADCFYVYKENRFKIEHLIEFKEKYIDDLI